MGVASGNTVVVVIAEVEIAGYEPRGDAQRAERRDHQHRKVATAPARKAQRAHRTLGPMLVPRHVPEGAVDGPRHVAKKLASVGQSVRGQKRFGPAGEPGVATVEEVTGEAGRVLHGVGKG